MEEIDETAERDEADHRAPTDSTQGPSEAPPATQIRKPTSIKLPRKKYLTIYEVHLLCILVEWLVCPFSMNVMHVNHESGLDAGHSRQWVVAISRASS